MLGEGMVQVSKKILIPAIIFLVIVTVIVIFFVSKSNAKEKEFSAADIFEHVDFDHEIDSFTLISVSRGGRLTELVLSEEWEQKLVNAFKQSKFEKSASPKYTPYYDYTISFTHDGTIYFQIDTRMNQILIFSKKNYLDFYSFKDQSDFIKILEEAVKNASVK